MRIYSFILLGLHVSHHSSSFRAIVVVDALLGFGWESLPRTERCRQYRAECRIHLVMEHNISGTNMEEKDVARIQAVISFVRSLLFICFDVQSKLYKFIIENVRWCASHISDKLNGIHLNEYFLHVPPLGLREHVAVVAKVVKEKYMYTRNRYFFYHRDVVRWADAFFHLFMFLIKIKSENIVRFPHDIIILWQLVEGGIDVLLAATDGNAIVQSYEQKTHHRFDILLMKVSRWRSDVLNTEYRLLRDTRTAHYRRMRKLWTFDSTAKWLCIEIEIASAILPHRKRLNKVYQ